MSAILQWNDPAKRRVIRVNACSMCRKLYSGFGNNAQPFEGRCCDQCNADRVLPERIRRHKRGKAPMADDDDDDPDLFGWAERGARRSDPETSWQAAYRDLSRRAGDRIRALTLHFIFQHGLTDFELGDRMGRQQTSAGKRRGELRDMGLIEDSSLRRNAPSGSPAIVWAITEMGKRVHLALKKGFLGDDELE